jgi:predicted ATPase/class 3 adenylate cyclase
MITSVEAPSGTVTFLFTDIETSTQQWEAAPEEMRDALARHDEILRSAFEANRGRVFAAGGDGFAVAFHRAGDALAAAIEAQRNLSVEQWPQVATIRVRMGLHTGEAEERDGNYFGTAVNRAARLMAISHGGQVICSEVTAGLVAAEATMVDLGEHRLRDLSAPQRVFQVLGTGLADRFPPLTSLDSYPGNLPLASTRFVGREGMVREVAKALKDSRIVTITGVGGVGKTRLAVQVAADRLAEFPDGVWLIELGGVGDPGSVEEVVASSIGVQARPGQPLGKSLLDFLRGRKLLLLVDNCEHLVAPVATLVERIIAECPRVQVLATSREGLAVGGERVLPLAPMEVPAGETLVATLHSEAVQLLVDRAVDVRPGFAVSADNAAVVGRLCRRLDGIPLALELAAARFRSMSPTDVLNHLDHRFRLLTGGRRTALSRQHTLRGAIDWSYGLLEDSERAALGRLGVFAGGFDLVGAENVAPAGEVETYDVADLVDRLVDKSLVVADLSGGAVRYRLLEMLRDYAWERLNETGEADEVSYRHAEYYRGFATEADAGLRGPDEEVWTDRVEQELDNLRAAVAWAVDTDHADLALGIIASLTAGFGNRIGAPFGPLAEQAAATPGATDHPLRCVALASAARAAVDRGDPGRARPLAESAVAEAARLPNDELGAWVRCRTLSGVSLVIGGTGDGERLREVAELRLEAANALGDPWERARALTMIAGTSFGEPSRLAGEEAIRLARRQANPTGLAFALMITAPQISPTDPGRATELLEEAIGIVTRTNNSFASFQAHQNLALTHGLRGDVRAACQTHLVAAQLASDSGDRMSACLALGWLAARIAQTGDRESAVLLATWAASHGGWQDDWMLGLEEFEELAGAHEVIESSKVEYLLHEGEAMEYPEALALATKCVERLGQDG